jgi:hypothetical protein
VRGIFIHDGNAIYWVEYRKAEFGMKAGLAIYRTDSPNDASGTSSPNPEYSGHYLGDTSGDVWLLNLDNYQYSAKPTGSVTTWKFTSVSGNIALAATGDENGAQVAVNVVNPSLLTPMPPTPPDLSRFTFATSDFGSKFEIEPVDNPNSLADPTLQICNGVFPSESHRKFRYQVSANPLTTSKYSFISSEAVQYESSIWAAQALKEIDSAVEKCSTKVAKIRTFPQTNGNSGSVRNLVSYSTTGKTKQNLLASFTVKGDKLVGVYVISNYMFGESEIKRWQNLAKKVGSRL